VTITCTTAGASIHYTLDGSLPDRGSLVYSGPFEISVDTTVRSIAYKNAMTDSAVSEAVYAFTDSQNQDPENGSILAVSVSELLILYGGSAELEIWNSGLDVLAWTAQSGASWLSLSQTQGESSGEHDILTVTVDWNAFVVDETKTTSISINGDEMVIPVTAIKAATPTISSDLAAPTLGANITFTADLSDLYPGRTVAFFVTNGGPPIASQEVTSDSVGKAVWNYRVPYAWSPFFKIQCRDETSGITSAWLEVPVTTARYKVLINEFCYDEVGTDATEFVELYNADTVSADISGWSLRSNNIANALGIDTRTDYLIPGAPLSGTTILPPGGYYVIGTSGVPEVDLIVSNAGASYGLWGDANEEIELYDGDGVLADAVVYEFNAGCISGYTLVKGRIWGTFQSQYGVSWSRFVDGQDSGSTGRDFGVRTATPGATNATSSVSSWVGPDVDNSMVGAELAGFHGAFVKPRVIDPTVAGTYNPSAIPVSPQGGKAIVAWDNTGGGNSCGSDFTLVENASYDIYVYIEPQLLSDNETEEWNIGLGGTEDAFGNALFAGKNGSTGVSWVFTRNATASLLKLVYHKDGGEPSTTWSTIATINLTGTSAGWRRLGIVISGTTVVGQFDGSAHSGSIASGLIGNMYIGYREAVANNALCRPPTIDMSN